MVNLRGGCLLIASFGLAGAAAAAGRRLLQASPAPTSGNEDAGGAAGGLLASSVPITAGKHPCESLLGQQLMR